MDKKMRDLINRLAEVIIEEFQIKIGETAEDIVEKVGGTITSSDDCLEYEGGIRKSNNDSFEIIIPNSSNKNRNRFTVAHELGHLFLHMGFKTNPKVWQKQEIGEIRYFRYGQADFINEEYQANEFAAALLMPRKEFRDILEKNTTENEVDMKEVASYFHVSEEAAIMRGRFLGYIAWV